MSTACFIDNAEWKQEISLHKYILEIEFTINFLSLNSTFLTNVRKISGPSIYQYIKLMERTVLQADDWRHGFEH
ncbi:MAG: hypothetical protein ACFWUL_08650 [Dialister sp.]|jgi:hypothetical protein